MFLKISHKIHGKTLALESFFNEVVGLMRATLLKKTTTQVFSCELGQIFKNTIFIEHLRQLLLDITVLKKKFAVSNFGFLKSKKICHLPWKILWLEHFRISQAYGTPRSNVCVPAHWFDRLIKPDLRILRILCLESSLIKPAYWNQNFKFIGFLIYKLVLSLIFV